jgi:hypothetical protein
MVALAVVAASGVASASAIGPNQHFIGLVNGTHTDAVVYTVCPGPAGPGRLGAPAGNQSVQVKRVASGVGDTGSAGNVIYGYIPGSPPAITSLNRYDTPGAIPTSAMVPCGGKGSVYFSSCALPQPCGAGAMIDKVEVKFENIAASGARQSGTR